MNTFSDAIVATVIASVISLAGVIYTQRSVYSQADRTDDRTAYKKLYNPIISDVYYFLELSALKVEYGFEYQVSKEHIQSLFNKIILHIDQEMIYASPELIAARHYIRQKEIRNGYDKEPPTDLPKIHLLLVFMSDLSSLVKRAGIFNKSSRWIVEKYHFLYAVWYLMTSLGGYNTDAKGILLVRDMIGINKEEISWNTYKQAKKIASAKYNGKDRFSEVLEFIATRTYARRPERISIKKLLDEAREIDERNPDYR